MAEIPCTGCTLPALAQRAMLKLVHRRLGTGEDYARFVERLVEDSGFREAANAALVQLATARPVAQA
jgi:hypothetical protein